MSKNIGIVKRDKGKKYCRDKMGKMPNFTQKSDYFSHPILAYQIIDLRNRPEVKILRSDALKLNTLVMECEIQLGMRSIYG